MIPPTSIDGTDITGATIDGTDVQEITVDGETVFTAVPQIPSTVVHQYTAANFTTSTWTDSVGSANMTVSGLTSSTLSNGNASVNGDGNDHGTADGPQDLPSNETFGIGFTLEGTDTSDPSNFFSLIDGSNRFQCIDDDFFDGTNGNFDLTLQDTNGNRISVSANSFVMDGSPHVVVINKNGDNASDLDFYIDDMSTPVGVNIHRDAGFSHTNYSPTLPLGFFARNKNGSISQEKAYDASIFEFNEDPYNQTERDGFKTRAGF